MSAVAKLKYELWTNKPLLRLDDTASDVTIWNDAIDEVHMIYINIRYNICELVWLARLVLPDPLRGIYIYTLLYMCVLVWLTTRLVCIILCMDILNNLF